MTRLLHFSSVGLLAACLFLPALAGLDQARAVGEMNFQVQLIWGTNGEKPKDKPLKEVDPKLQEKLKGIFKWKDYYEVNRAPLTAVKENAQKVKLSNKCEIQVQDVGNSRIEIRLFGEGTLVVRKVQTVVPGEGIILGGDSENKTAWLVVLTPLK